jgi:2-amino-4-hydroxy-6-hydroxymethyldihydropteridine diphosphokinase
MLWRPAYVGLGSNLERPAVQVRRALEALDTLPDTRLIARSSLFGSKPWGPVAQPDFVNAAAGLLTQLDASGLFSALRALESSLGGATPRERWGPRLIDIDLLLFDRERVETAELRLPHPGIVERNFVLYPLRELAPDLTVPGCGRVAELAARVDSGGIWRLDQGPHGA